MKTAILFLLLLALSGCALTAQPPAPELPADCAPLDLGCFSTCPGEADTCAYVYTGKWPDPGSSCTVYQCVEKHAEIPGCAWEVWQSPAKDGEGFVCGDGPRTGPVNSCIYPGCG